MAQSVQVELGKQRLEQQVQELRKELEIARKLPSKAKVEQLNQALARQDEQAGKLQKHARYLEETLRRVNLRLETRERELSNLQREYDRVCRKLKQLTDENATP